MAKEAILWPSNDGPLQQKGFGQKLLSQIIGTIFNKGLVEINNPSTFFAGNTSQLNKYHNISLGKDAGNPGNPGLQS